jgi:X-X-X-Leu-X-X-Gly heptad repeat protein
MVPEGWRRDSFGTLVRVGNGYAFAANNFTDLETDIPVVRMSNLKTGRLDLTEAKRLPASLLRGLDSFRLQTGDFIFGMSGSLTNHAWVTASDLPCYLNQRVGRLIPKVGTDPRFAAYLYLSDQVQQGISQLAAGAAQLNISPSQIESIVVPCPPPDEQRRIAAVLSTVDEALHAAQVVMEQASRLYDELRLCLPQQMPGTPRVLGELVLIAWGNTSITKASYVPNGAKAFSAAGNDGCVANAEHRGPGIVLSAIGARCGKCFWADGDWTAIKNTITITNQKPDLNLRYLYHLANSPSFWPTGGGAQPFISQGDARALTMSLPSKIDQDRIAAMLDALESTMLTEQQQVESLKTMKRGLLDDLLTGRVRVPATALSEASHAP